MHTPTKLTESGYAYRTKKKIPKKHNYLGKEETQATEKNYKHAEKLNDFIGICMTSVKPCAKIKIALNNTGPSKSHNRAYNLNKINIS